MSDLALSALSAASALGGTEKTYVVQGGSSKYALASQIKTYIIGAGSVSIASGKTLTVSNTLTFTGTDSSSVAFGTGGVVLYNPMTTGGDVIYGGASGVPTRLANGSNGQVLTSSGGTAAPTWTTVSGGGASSPLTTKGDLWGYTSADARVPVGSNGKFLTADSSQTAGVAWEANLIFNKTAKSLVISNATEDGSLTISGTSSSSTANIGTTVQNLSSAGYTSHTLLNDNGLGQVSLIKYGTTHATFADVGWLVNTAGRLHLGTFASADVRIYTNNTLAATFASGGNMSVVGSIADSKGDVRTIPINSKSADYTTVLADAGKTIYHPPSDTTPRTFTIDSNANVAYPIGTAITFDNDIGAGVITIAITSDTLVLVGLAGSTGSRTLDSGGQATAIKVASTRWRISGVGLT